MCNILENLVLKEYYINELFGRSVYGGVWGDKTPNRIKNRKTI